jgi:hypothetical protein
VKSLFPKISKNDVAYHRLANSHKSGNCGAGHTVSHKASGFSDFFPCQFSSGGVFSFCGSAFRNTISSIICVCAEKQMARIYASSVVASVKHTKALGNGLEMDKPRSAVSEYIATVRELEPPIACCEMGCPSPTSSKLGSVRMSWTVFINLFKKTVTKTKIESLRKCWVLGIGAVCHSQLSFDCGFVAPVVNAMRGNFNNVFGIEREQV